MASMGGAGRYGLVGGFVGSIAGLGCGFGRSIPVAILEVGIVLVEGHPPIDLWCLFPWNSFVERVVVCSGIITGKERWDVIHTWDGRRDEVFVVHGSELVGGGGTSGLLLFVDSHFEGFASKKT